MHIYVCVCSHPYIKRNYKLSKSFPSGYCKLESHHSWSPSCSASAPSKVSDTEESSASANLASNSSAAAFSASCASRASRASRAWRFKAWLKGKWPWCDSCATAKKRLSRLRISAGETSRSA